MSAYLVRRGLQCADGALRDQQRRRHLDRRDDLEALALEEAHDAAEDAVVAGGGDDARNGRKIEEEAEVRLDGAEIRPAHRADDDHLRDVGVAQRAHHAADLRPADLGKWKIAQVAVAFADDGHDVHRSAARHDMLGDLARQATAARYNADDAPRARHLSSSLGCFFRRAQAALAAGADERENFLHDRLAGELLATSSVRSTSVPSAANNSR